MPQGHVACHGPRLRHRGALPVLAHALVICDCGGHRDGGRGRRRVGTQAQIGAEHVAVRVAGLHHGNQRACDACERGPQRLPLGLRVGVVEQDEVDITGIVQLARAQLAHPQHHQPAPLGRPRRVGQGECARIMSCEQEVTDRKPQRRLRQLRQGGRDPRQGPCPANVGERHDQRGLPFGPPHRRSNGRAHLRRAGRRQRAHDGAERRIGPVAREGLDRRVLPHREVRQERAAAAHGPQQRGAARGRCKRRGIAGPPGEALDQALGRRGVGGAGPGQWDGEHRPSRWPDRRAAVNARAVV